MGFCAHRRREECGRRLTARATGGLQTCPTLPGGKAARAGRSRSYFPVWHRIPHRRHFHDHRELPRRRAGTAVTSGPHAPAGTRAPGYVCRRWSNHDALVSSLVQRRHSDRRAARFRTCPTLPGGKVARAGRSRSYFPVWHRIPSSQIAMITASPGLWLGG